MSELTKELEQDKAFIEKVSNKIYSNTDDIEESIPEPEWIGEMTDIAEKYITRFETSYNFANSLADELLASNIDLNDNQKIVLEWLKSNRNSLKVPMLAIYELAELPDENTNLAYRQLDSKQEFEVLAAFAQWGLKQEEAE
ncbi:hypothetical protein FUT28_14490 [Enterococcus durans]|uniref:hypothetical protein n=1 Tax=Enterococcus durans TaxID=53345 RepID=UPI0011BF53B5|nr:hypothetical protein [Enterococcus durans]QED60866.1 hypothetical protein FS851_14520 [Enterococcus durans]QED63458.1 hypothetical protein FUT28_14490 [Enterococcus durans]